jgi:hypothetical protein
VAGVTIKAEIRSRDSDDQCPPFLEIFRALRDLKLLKIA